MNNIMLDLETMGSSSTSAIVTIGACYFGDKKIGKTFYCKIDLKSAMKYGTVDAATILWWLKQDENARKEIYEKKDAISLPEALKKFSIFCKPDSIIWGCGSDFDNTILCNAYRNADMKLPWKYYNNRCFRTLKNLSKIKDFQENNDKHNALSDAIYQAKYAMETPFIFE